MLFSLLFLAMGGLIAWFGYAQGRDLTLSATERVFEHIGRETHLSLNQTLAPVGDFADVLALQPFVEARNLPERLQALPLLQHAFTANPQIEAVYAGYADGSFFLLRLLHSEAERSLFAAPAPTRYMVQSVERREGAAPSPLYLFFDEHLRELERRAAPEYDYDPRTRIWYELARTPGQRVLTEPYAFFSTGTPGVTVARRANARSVVGIDVTLAHLSSRLSALSTLPGMRTVLFDEQRRLLASSDTGQALVRRVDSRAFLSTLEDSGDPLLASLQPATQTAGNALNLQVRGKEWKSVVLPIDTARGPLFLAIAVPLDELLKDLRETRKQHVLISLALLICGIPLTMLMAHSVARGMRRVTAQANDIRAFQFDGPSAGRSLILEIDQLSLAMDKMRDTIRNFQDVAISLAEETNFDRLLERVVWETCQAVDAVGGLVYLPDAEDRSLTPAALMDYSGRRLQDNVDAIAMQSGSPVAVAFRDSATRLVDLTAQSGSEFAPFQGLWPEHRLSAVAIPLRQRDGERVGVLVLFTPHAETPNRARLAFAEALSGTAAIAIETQRLVEARKQLLDALIRLVAGAIDAKSPYTGAHCQRVPELTLMLARAACEATTGPYKDFRLDDQQWETLQIASWLHDCGKVVTPEYVVDKSTKLETIYDRLHEIRTRFEVLKRDVRIETLEKIAAGGDAAILRAECDRRLAELDDDFAFVASCNEGGEFMRPESIARLERIGQRTWQRTLDDRIGLSADEKQRKARTPTQALPATERLLDDKPEHCIERAVAEELPPDNEWGFKLSPPRHKFNQGELHNLRVARGTLTAEERYIINHHIVQTIIMLSQLPFPRYMREVPQIAGGHHEKMDGTGYPKGLKRDEMSETARMMAIADIFEALTASDRPYKNAKTLSESLGIMQRMKCEGHIDPELYELFLDSGVWRRYAERFLHPEQIDIADISPYR
ncbi:MAG TPA: HD domain-containing phosphohydrolase [Burkholderiales bacterium]